MAKTRYMVSDFPPWQVFRWRYNEEINIIERFDAEKKTWVAHHNDLLLGAFHHQTDAGLSDIDPVTDEEAARITADGLTSEK